VVGGEWSAEARSYRYRENRQGLLSHMNKNNQEGEVIGRSAMAGGEHATMYEGKDQEVQRSLE
jgi:hypothetical protein